MISIIIPSIRPINLEQTLAQLIMQEGDYEIITITDFEVYPRPEKVKSIMSERKGCIDAIYKGELAAQGDYLIVLSDQAVISEDGLIEMERFSKIHNDRIIVSQDTIPRSNLEYYGRYFAPYPFVHRNIVDVLGGLFLPIYKSFYADPDFCMRAWEAEIPIIKCPGVTITRPNGMDYSHHNHNFNKYALNDCLTFQNRWNHLGDFKEPN